MKPMFAAVIAVAVALEKKLGPEYAALVEALNDMDADSKAAQEIDDTLSALDEMCGN